MEQFLFFLQKQSRDKYFSLINIKKTLNKYLSIIHLRKRRQIFVTGA